MIRRLLPASLVALFFMLPPAVAMAQRAGTLHLTNSTNATIRIGCDHYIDSAGRRVNLRAYWTFSPGFSGKLTTAKGAYIVAQKFVFYEITPEGETAGWFFGTVDKQGLLSGSLTQKALATHKKDANKGKSGYPPLTANDIAVINLKNAIASAEKRLADLNIGIPVLQVTLDLAKTKYDQIKNDPKTANGTKLLATVAITTAEVALNKATTERNTVRYNLSTYRARLSRLQQ